MTFKENCANDVQNIFLNTDEHAEEVEFTPYGGSETTITVVWNDMGVQEREVRGDWRKVGVAHVQASKTDSASPDTRDLFVRNEVKWPVKDIINQDDYMVLYEVITHDVHYIGAHGGGTS